MRIIDCSSDVCSSDLSIDEAISASDAPPIKQRVNGYDAFRASLQPELGEFGEFFGFTQSSVDGDSASGQAILMQRPGRTEIRRALNRQPVADISLVNEAQTGKSPGGTPCCERLVMGSMK